MLTLPRPGPEARALAGLWAWALDVVVLASMLVVIADAFAPRQDLPWKPLRLVDPPGLATAMKFREAAASPAACRAVLSEGGVTFNDVPIRTDGACGQLNAGRIVRGTTPLTPAGPVMTCPVALAYAFWDRHELQPAAEALGTRATVVTHYGTYACRTIAGRDRLSEHAFANALDVAQVNFADGRRLSVLGNFRDEGAEGQFLRRIRDGACRWFRSTLSPDYNAAHADHLHLDQGRYAICR